MNRSLLPLFTVSLLGSLAVGCSSSSTSSPSSGDVGEASSDLARNTSPNVAAGDMTTLTNDNAAFATDAYKAIGAIPANVGKNVFYSPYSISSALAMTYAGANGVTATEMASAMHFSLDQSKLHPAFDQLDLALTADAAAPVEADQKPLALHVANAIFGEKLDSFGKPFLDTLKTNYGAGVQLVDFEGNPDGSRVAINGWISDQTNAKIQNMLAPGTIDDSTRVVLVDAIYFDGNWSNPFDPKSTQDAPFTKLDGSSVSASTMSNGDLDVPVASTPAYDAIELAYAGNRVAMDIVVPKAGTFAAFEAGLTGASMNAIFSGLQTGPATVAMPKFKIAGDTISLKDMLQGLGMKTAFTGDADFSAIDLTTKVHIGDVLHKAYVSVDESGTEAAAATAVIMAGSAARTGSPIAVNANRPFFFALRDLTTGAVLFAGRVTDPTE